MNKAAPEIWEGGSPKKWQNFGKYFGFLGCFFPIKSPLDRLLDLICTRQGSNLQPYDPKSHTVSGQGRAQKVSKICRYLDTFRNPISDIGKELFFDRRTRVMGKPS